MKIIWPGHKKYAAYQNVEALKQLAKQPFDDPKRVADFMTRLNQAISDFGLSRKASQEQLYATVGEFQLISEVDYGIYETYLDEFNALFEDGFEDSDFDDAIQTNDSIRAYAMYQLMCEQLTSPAHIDDCYLQISRDPEELVVECGNNAALFEMNNSEQDASENESVDSEAQEVVSEELLQKIQRYNDAIDEYKHMTHSELLKLKSYPSKEAGCAAIDLILERLAPEFTTVEQFDEYVDCRLNDEKVRNVISRFSTISTERALQVESIELDAKFAKLNHVLEKHIHEDEKPQLKALNEALEGHKQDYLNQEIEAPEFQQNITNTLQTSLIIKKHYGAVKQVLANIGVATAIVTASVLAATGIAVVGVLTGGAAWLGLGTAASLFAAAGGTSAGLSAAAGSAYAFARKAVQHRSIFVNPLTDSGKAAKTVTDGVNKVHADIDSAPKHDDDIELNANSLTH